MTLRQAQRLYRFRHRIAQGRYDTAARLLGRKPRADH